LGCGPKIAVGLAHAGFGDSLLTAAWTLTQSELNRFLCAWREDLCYELMTNPHRCLPSRQPVLSASIPDSFPSLDILFLYIRPLISPFPVIDQGPAWTSQNINIERMAKLCERTFSWGGTMIITKFINIIWSGVSFRQVLEVYRCDLTLFLYQLISFF